MFVNFAELVEALRIATEALARYTLRTTLSVLGVVLGIVAVIAMTSVSEGAARQALAQVESLGLDNLVARSHGTSAYPVAWRGLTVADATRAESLLPLVRHSSAIVQRYLRVAFAGHSATTQVLGVRPSFAEILRLTLARGRFLSDVDERVPSRTCVLGATIAGQLFGFHDPLGQWVTIGADAYQVVGVLRGQAGGTSATGTMAWHLVDRAAFVPLPALSGRTLTAQPEQPADEVWLQIADGGRAEEIGALFTRALAAQAPGREFSVVVPRELLAQRYRTQRTFSVVVGSVAALALIVGGIGIMNIMLTSVVERTREIGVRRTVGATRRSIAVQFLVEALLMTLSGGVLGIVIGIGVSSAITALAGWETYVSVRALVLASVVSMLVGLVFGLYPATKAAALQPVDAMRYE